jgi:hypothetical protein
VGDAHRGSSAPEREILLSTELVALLKKLQLLADGISPADPNGRASRRPNKDGARHGEPRSYLTNLLRDGGWGCECSEFGALAPCREGKLIKGNSKGLDVEKWREYFF